MTALRPRAALAAAAFAIAAFASAAAASTEAAWTALKAGGHVLIVRHAQTVPGIGDPPGFRLDDCSTQRNLSAAGREEARRIGAGFERRGIDVDEVLSSRWCRCLDTARLAFPRHEVRLFDALDSFFADASTRQAQTEALRARLARLGPTRRIVLVTHQVNIAALTGQSVGMGEALLVRLGADEAGELLGRLHAA